MCKRNTPDKNEASMGCVRETLLIKNKNKRGGGGEERNNPARDV